jgi:peptidoglycan/xylan/chitin deacetylase (PgdA/CDA1 family)
MSKLSFGPLVVICALFCGCTTSHHDDGPSVSAGNETKGGKILREIASSVSEENLNRSFSDTFNKNETEATQGLLDQVTLLTRLYSEADLRIEEFDRDLDQAAASLDSGKKIEALESPSYAKLLALRMLMDNSTQKISYIYTRLLEIQKDPTAPDEIKAVHIQRAFDRAIIAAAEKSDADQIVLQNLFTELDRSYFEVENQQQEKRGLRPYSYITWKGGHFKKWILQSQDLQKRLRDADTVLKLRAQKTIFQSGMEKSRAEVDALTEELRKEIVVPHEDRQPQALPALHIGDTLTGNNFPSGVWALTYDDGPDRKLTPMAVKNLNDNHMKATFFWLAKNVKSLKSVVDEVKQGYPSTGFPIGDHSYTHPDLSKADAAHLNYEITESASVIRAAISPEQLEFFRCPYGAGFQAPRVRSLIAAGGMVNVFWNVDSLDWQDKNANSVLARTQKQMAMQKHGIILFHDIHPQSIEATRMLMEWVNAQNAKTPGAYSFMTLPEITTKYFGGIQK